MNNEMLVLLTVILVAGSFAQWLAWKLNLPSILLLLGGGLLLGPGTGVLDPDADFGKLLFPMVSLGVALILFEGGLTLKLKEFRESGGTILRLISVGALVCAVLTGLFAHWILGFSVELSALLGAILVITGPTVIGPMLRQIRPRGKVSYVVKWEGILNDPVGALAAVLVYEAFRTVGMGAAQMTILEGVLLTMAASVLTSVAGAFLLVMAMRYRWLPDYLHVPITLAVVIASFTLSEAVQKESGLLSVTFLGILLANQRSFPVKHILEFKENLQVMLISGLFIVLGARVEVETLFQIGPASVLFLIAMIVVVRPATVLVSTWGSTLNWRERFFLMLMAPRGIVVTAIASLFTLRMIEDGRVAEAETFFAEILFVIFGTVIFYGLTASFYARRFQISSANPNGLALVGAHPWARMLAVSVRDEGIPVVLIDSNESNVAAARAQGFQAYLGNIHSKEFLESIDFSEMGRALALTANAEVNAFAEIALSSFLGRSNVYHLTVGTTREREPGASMESPGSVLFGESATYEVLEKRFYGGQVVQRFRYDPEVGIPETVIPLFCRQPNEQFRVFSSRSSFVPKAGATILALGRAEDVPPMEDGGAVKEVAGEVSLVPERAT